MIRLARTFAACLLVSSATRAEEMPVIDCHVHLFDIARTEGVTWIAADDKVLRRSFLPADHEPIAKANGVTGVVLDGSPLAEEWIASLRAVAQQKNVFCKVSALYGRVKEQPAPKDIAFYSPGSISRSNASAKTGSSTAATGRSRNGRVITHRCYGSRGHTSIPKAAFYRVAVPE